VLHVVGPRDLPERERPRVWGFYALATQMGLLANDGDKLRFWTEQLNGLRKH